MRGPIEGKINKKINICNEANIFVILMNKNFLMVLCLILCKENNFSSFFLYFIQFFFLFSTITILLKTGIYDTESKSTTKYIIENYINEQ